MNKLWELLVLCVAPHAAYAAGSEPYRTVGDCDGFPAVTLRVAEPLCVGLVAQKLGFARGVAVIHDDVFVADMGGWGSRRGRLLKLPQGGRGAPEVVLKNLDQPNALLRGPGRSLYLGLAGQVLKVDPYAAEPTKALAVVVTGLPRTGRHPLPALALGPDGALFVNVGSASDHCESEGRAPDPKAPCPETLEQPPRGSILRFSPRASTWDARQQAPYATGLRNSMAMVVLPQGGLVVATNARDAISQHAPSLSDKSLPHDLLVAVQPGADLGWPYCYDRRVPSPEYPGFDCRTKRAPDLLLPAHAAPLGMVHYQGQRLPGMAGRLIIGFHGYRDTGHRLVSVALNPAGVPVGAPTELVSAWGHVPGEHPQGSPVGLAEMADGSVLVTEDHNGTLLRLSTKGARR